VVGTTSPPLERYLAIRVLVATVILGSILITQVVAQEVLSVRPLYTLIVYVLAYSLGSVFLYLALGFRPWLLHLQFLLDLSAITALVYLTGSYRSPLSILYVLFIAFSGLTLSRAGLFRLAAGAVIFYGLMVLAVLFRWVPLYASEWFPIDPEPAKPALYNLMLHLTGLFLTAWLVSIPAEHARRSQRQAIEEHQKLQSTQEVLHFIVRQFPAGLVLTDAQGRVSFMNSTAQSILESFPGTDDRPWWERLGTTLEGAALQTESTWRFRSTSPQGRTYDVQGVRFLDAARGSLWWLWVLRDVTEDLKRQQQERLHERMRATAEMAAGLAHEIKNPLAAIHAAVQLLARQSRPEDREVIEILVKETARLRDVIDHFVQFASPAPLNPRVFPLAQAIGDVVRLAQMIPTDDGPIQWSMEVIPESLTLRADENQIKQVLWNLIVNALQAMPRGGALRLKARQEGHWVHLSVQDTGPGIPPERLRTLFQPFQPSSTGGLGLGLAIVYNIVQAHGGYIEVTSQPQQGTRFDIWLPSGIV
jgi:two-component system sensor histidine kinase PilS (NtrC family)